MTDFALVSELSDAERQLLMDRLYDLLNQRTTKYLAGDSTSIPVETAEELFQSILYTLRFVQTETGKSARELLDTDLAELLQQGQHMLQCKLAAVRQLWEQACMTVPRIPNDYLHDTLKSIQGFFKRFDGYNFAHQIPCTIDYPLSIPVSEKLQGVTYIEQWLKHLLIENWFLSRFQQQTVCHLLAQVVADYWAYPINLCEQPMINAVGLALLHRSVLSLALSDDDCRALESLLLECGDIEATLQQGIVSVTTELRAPKDVDTYIKAVLGNTFPRIQLVRQHGSLKGVFVPS